MGRKGGEGGGDGAKGEGKKNTEINGFNKKERGREEKNAIYMMPVFQKPALLFRGAVAACSPP